MTPYFLKSFSKGQSYGSSAALNANDRFDCLTCGNATPALRVLSAISNNCRFFHAQVYKSTFLGSILATEGVPSPDRLSNSSSVYTFLSMKPGSDNLYLLLG